MMLLVDTTVIIDVLVDEPQWADRSLARLRGLALAHELTINPVIYTGLSLAFSTLEALDRAMEQLALAKVEISRPALFLAGKAFLQYRRQGGTKANVLSDLFVGAHAAVLGCAVPTRDARRYRSYFPSVRLISPDSVGR